MSSCDCAASRSLPSRPEHDARSPLRPPVHSAEDRPGYREEPLLPGAALQRHGHAMPLAHAAMREVKAEGGWAVVSTEECEIHPSGDLTPYVEARLWDDRDIPALALMCDKVHAHGALAALELSHNGPTASNLYSREVLLAPSHQPSKYGYPSQARAMTRHDIREYRRWHREAAI